MRKNIFLISVLLLVMVAGLGAATISSPAATVNLIRNQMISMSELDDEYNRYVAMGAQGVTKADALDTLINNEVFLQGAERDGITVTDRQVDQLYAQAKANAAAQAGRTVSDAEFEAEVNRQFGSVDAYKQALKEQYIVNQYVMLKKGAELQNIPMPSDSEIASADFSAHVSEHAIEVQLPFLQYLSNNFKILPIVMGTQSLITASDLSSSIVKAGEKLGKSYCIIASTDLSHFNTQERANEVDSFVLEDILSLIKFSPKKLIPFIYISLV